jgi:AcrR family transcriptional regulator
MSRTDGADRLIAAAIALGVVRGLGAMSVQGIATAAGVSKALVLYHHADKPTLLRAVHARLVAASTERLLAAGGRVLAADPLESWRTLARGEVRRGELALLAALRQDSTLRTVTDADHRANDAARVAAAGRFVQALLRALEITPRVDAPLFGAMLLRQLDGLVIAHLVAERGALEGTSPPVDADLDADLDAELDAFALALLGLGG